MHIAIKPTNIIKENTKGGLCNSRMEKSTTNKLVKKGWSSKAERIFLQIAIVSVISALILRLIKRFRLQLFNIGPFFV
jgi:hypothetical protein